MAIAILKFFYFLGGILFLSRETHRFDGACFLQKCHMPGAFSVIMLRPWKLLED